LSSNYLASVIQKFCIIAFGVLCLPALCHGSPIGSSPYPIVLRSLKIGVVTIWLSPSGTIDQQGKEQRLFTGTAMSPSRMPGRHRRSFVGWAAGSQMGTDGSIDLNFAAQGPLGAPVHLSLTRQADGTLSAISRVPSKGVPRVCGTVDKVSRVPTPPSLFTADSTTQLLLNFSTSADALLGNRLGARTNSVIARVVNSASAMYKRQLDIAIKIRSQFREGTNNAYPTRITNADQLLTRFQSRSLRKRQAITSDVSFLFTSRKMNDQIVGLAYVGVVCSSTENSFGIVRLINSAIDPVTTAHEIGHTLGANHTTSGIMSAVLSKPYPDSFSPNSVAEISGYIDQYGQCLRN
jgi:hypothetical protein